MKHRSFEGSRYLSELFMLTYNMGSYVPLPFSMTPIFRRKGVRGAPQVKSPHINTSYE